MRRTSRWLLLLLLLMAAALHRGPQVVRMLSRSNSPNERRHRSGPLYLTTADLGQEAKAALLSIWRSLREKMLSKESWMLYARRYRSKLQEEKERQEARVKVMTVGCVGSKILSYKRDAAEICIFPVTQRQVSVQCSQAGFESTCS
ncbi:hypothetical protein K437DRAFT_262628 [Tilletiaria anomala UBC 951]|uniref:Uncharacterized protein n=1 Tax=Tilletiaria anomala (strain ATCC 24038 / CBS 436.72 / UBC 951) TaxID=1037660 RepID=A0A066VY14_TILAU|nr:uncharacterized protein K437DRAFT_262628 [Tilletiaria anomala UBC 951]KDN46632.1 hypothetical protein K437DRAFT_262628 [Tilletiaria anomala UBC 951]